MQKKQEEDKDGGDKRISASQLSLIAPLTALFTASGVAGLVYQVSWQRVLFAAFGSDIESVSLIVSAFMLGLGLGALGGGRLADRFPGNELKLFALCEAGIGLFGLVSVPLLRGAGDAFVQSPLWVVGLVNFLIVLVPTVLMGGTLPILIAGVARLWGHVGEATGHLYAANTVGAAGGAIASGFLLFQHIELPLAVRLTAGVNLLVAVFALGWLRRMK